MYIDREELEERLTPFLEQVRNNNHVVDLISKKMLDFNILEGDTINYFNQPETIADMDLRALCLFTMFVQEHVRDSSLDITEIFTPNDIKEAKQYNGAFEIEKEEDILPLIIEGADALDSTTILTKLNIQQINKMLDKEILYYDFNTQREAKWKRKGSTIIQTPKINQKSVKEISKCILDDTLVKTVLTFNATIGSSDEENELIYNEKKRTVTITKGTKIAIIDGFHRVKGIQMALAKNPHKEFVFPVLLTNYSVEKAAQYLGQISKANPISKTRAAELLKSRKADEVVQYLKESSELKGRISQTERIHSINNEIVTYNILADTIEKEFKLKTRIDVIKVGKYLSEFFDILMGLYSDAFIDNVVETKNKSLINDNNMFVGYIVLARRLYEQDKPIDINVIEGIMSNIDFSYDNPLWEELALTKDGKKNHRTHVVRTNIMKYFNRLEI